MEEKKLPPAIQYLADKMEEKKIKIVFGLVQQGHIPTIEKMISEHSAVTEINKDGVDLSSSSYLWDKISKEIGWVKETAMLHYISYLRKQLKEKSA